MGMSRVGKVPVGETGMPTSCEEGLFHTREVIPCLLAGWLLVPPAETSCLSIAAGAGAPSHVPDLDLLTHFWINSQLATPAFPSPMPEDVLWQLNSSLPALLAARLLGNEQAQGSSPHQ